MKDFRLIETMRVLASGEVYLLERHLERLSRSASYFSFACDLARVREEILKSVPRDGVSVCLRLTLAKDGELSLAGSPLPTGRANRLKLSSVRVNSQDIFLRHKTTNRAPYEKARLECDEHTDVILINEREEITEATVMNIAVFRDGRWITPQESCGVLPGVLRQELLSCGEIVEGVISTAQLQPGEVIRCFNALRGVADAKLVLSTAA